MFMSSKQARSALTVSTSRGTSRVYRRDPSITRTTTPSERDPVIGPPLRESLTECLYASVCRDGVL